MSESKVKSTSTKDSGTKVMDQRTTKEIRRSEEPSATVQSVSISARVLELEAGRKYYRLIEMTKMVAKRKTHALMAMGDVGVGKSTIIRDTLEREGLEENKDFIFVRGYSTPMALYQKLYENKESGKTIVIDDCDVVLKNKTALDILKAVLDDKYQRIVSYETRRKSGELPKSFVFSGSVIFITNYRPKNDDVHFAAIQDRCMVQKLYLTTREKIEYIEKIIVPEDYKSTTPEDRKAVFELMKDGVIQGGIKFSYRTFFQLLDFYIHDRENFNVHLTELIPCDTEVTLILELLRERPDEEDTEYMRSQYMERTGKSRRSFYYALRKAKDLLPRSEVH